jgi:hypothetical protein
MRAVNFESVEWKGHASHRTKAGVSMKRLLQGSPGPLNYELTTVKPAEDYTTPRHRHNFEQFMYIIEGRWEFGVGDEGAATEGMIGYIPEGSYYGPQRLAAGSFSITLQFGGASGLGFLAYDEWYRAQSELSETGRFEKGRFFRNGSDGDEGQDAFEAIWEHVNQRTVEYPKPRYSRPFAIDPAAFGSESIPAGARQRLGTFTERRWAIDLYRWDRQGEIELGSAQQSLLILLDGSVSVGGETFPTLSAFELEEDEKATFSAEEGARALCVTMADFSRFEPVAQAQTAAAVPA